MSKSCFDENKIVIYLIYRAERKDKLMNKGKNKIKYFYLIMLIF